MCGITGLIDLRPDRHGAKLRDTIETMNAALIRRGPDDVGIWCNEERGLALGQRRLAIIELSELGHQPILSSSGRYAMTFNGEIYNFVELAQELGKYRDDFAPSSDTQVMMAAFEQWGIAEALKRLDGMFAILCYDQQENILHIARDRMGEKPMYLGCHEKKILFSSELKAMQSVFGRKPELDIDAVTLFLRHSYIPAPYSIYRHIFKLPPATLLSLDVASADRYIEHPQQLLEKARRYWTLPETPEEQVSEAGFEPLLKGVVQRQMRSDVALGAFLSGGVDSSTIVSLMQQVSDKRVKTFSIGFEIEAFNEAPYAKDIARHLNTEHHERILSAKEVMDTIPDLAQIYDEPFADSSQLPTILVSKLAREHVTVSLSGDGGDEIFGGYERYHWAKKLWRWFDWMPFPSKRVVAKLLLLIAEADISGLPMALRKNLSRFRRLSAMLSEKERQYFYRALISSQSAPRRFVIGGDEPEYGLTRPTMTEQEFLYQMMYLDMHNYLPDDILTKVDRASMHSSLELRAPLLDHHVLEYAWGLRSQATNHAQNNKTVLRNILYQHVPRELIERPKRGFAVPLESWLRGPLRDWAGSYLNAGQLRQQSVLNAAEVMKVWEDFLKGRPGAQYFLWNVLMFQLWNESWS